MPELPPAIILAGGFGTRLREAAIDAPKPMAPVAGRPFIEYVLHRLIRNGVRRIVLSTHHRSEMIERHFADGKFEGAMVDIVREPEPLGTGGAIAHALFRTGARGWFFALNGDSLAPIDVADLLSRVKKFNADGVIVTARTNDARRFGTLEFDGDNGLTGFREKAVEAGSGWINGGVYLLKASLFADMENAAFSSLERDLIPRWLKLGKRFVAARVNGPFLDIGVPETLALAEQFVSEQDDLAELL